MNFRQEAAVSPMAWWQVALTWICRIVCGGVFIFSAIAKGIDPWGTIYKISDYLGVMHIDWASQSLIVAAVFLLFSLEFITGIFLLTGSFRRFAPMMMLLFMAGMLPLTLWIAVADPVADCGCFGDALIISNWATFWKNVVLTLMGIWLLLRNRRVHWLVTPALQWILFIISVLYIVAVGLDGYIVQPVIDFREYKVGGPLVTADAQDDAEFVFIYEKDGMTKEFSQDQELPSEDDGWTFVDRRRVDKETSAVQRPLRIWSEYGDEDITADVAAAKGDKQMLLLIPSMHGVSIASTWKINELREWADNHDIDFIALAPATNKQLEEWKDVSMADYPIYFAEDTDIKEVARGNPAVVYTEDGNIKWKSTLRALPSDEKLDAAPDAISLYHDMADTFRAATVVAICILAVLIMASFIPKTALLSRRRQR